MSGQSNHIFRRINRNSKSRAIAESLIVRPHASGVRRITTLERLHLAGGSLEIVCLDCDHVARRDAGDLVASFGGTTELRAVRCSCGACGSARTMMTPVDLTRMEAVPTEPRPEPVDLSEVAPARAGSAKLGVDAPPSTSARPAPHPAHPQSAPAPTSGNLLATLLSNGRKSARSASKDGEPVGVTPAPPKKTRKAASAAPAAGATEKKTTGRKTPGRSATVATRGDVKIPGSASRPASKSRKTLTSKDSAKETASKKTAVPKAATPKTTAPKATPPKVTARKPSSPKRPSQNA